MLGSAAQLSQIGKITPNSLLLVGTGFCGSFTTFSTFSVDVVALVEKEMFLRAFSVAAATNIFGISVRAASSIF